MILGNIINEDEDDEDISVEREKDDIDRATIVKDYGEFVDIKIYDGTVLSQVDKSFYEKY